MPSSLRPSILLILLLGAARLSAAELPGLVFSMSPDGGPGPVAVTLKTAKLSYSFEVIATAGEIENVSVAVSSLRDSAGQSLPVTVQVNGSPTKVIAKVPALQSFPVTIEADLPEAGDYTCDLALIYQDKSQPPALRRQNPLTLKITRPAPAPPDLEIAPDPLVPAAGDAAVKGPSSAVLPVALREKTGRSVEVETPQILLLTVKGTGDAKYLAPGSLKVIDAASGQPLPSRIAVAGTTRQIQLRIGGLAGAGRYDGTIRFTPQGGTPVDKTFALYLRDPWWVAVFSILAGVLMSLGLYRYLVKSRPRLVEQKRAQVLLAELEDDARLSGLDTREINLIRNLRRELTSVVAGLIGETDLATSSKTLDVLQAKVPLVATWVGLRHEVRHLLPLSLRTKLEGDLDAFEKDLLAAADIKAVETASQKLFALPGEIEREIKKDLGARLNTLDDAVKKKLESADPALANALREVKPLLEQARDAEREGDVPAGVKALANAQVAYAGVLARDLIARLEGAPPAGLTPQDWAGIRAQVLAVLDPALKPAPDPDTATQAVRSAYRLYLYGFAGALLRRIPAELTEIRRRVEDAQRLVREEKLDEAAIEINLAHDEYVKASTPAAPQGKRDAGPVKAPALTPAPDLFDPLRAVFPAKEVGPARDMAAAIERQLQLSDWLATGIVLLIAVALGLTAVWASNPAWGGWGDRLLAVLWGLGLHGFTFDGIKGLLTRFSA